MILELRRRRGFLSAACGDRRNKEGIHPGVTFGDKTDVNGVPIRRSFLEPEGEAAVVSEIHEIWGTILA